MNVLLDRHHADLLESLHRLFEDRLGMTCYVPYGMEWKREGVWQFGQGYPDGGMGVAKQFLVDAPAVDDLQPHRTLRQVTLEEAQAMDWRLVLASVPDNYAGYHAFAQEHGAQFGIQVGNVNQWVDLRLDPFLLDSTGMYGHGTQFTPEFDTEDFRFVPNTVGRGVASFVNLFAKYATDENPYLRQLWAQFEAFKSAYTGPLRLFGHECPDGFIKPTAAIGELMGWTDFGYHDKASGDGFGYVIHYWASVGRPLVGHASHYAGQLAADLWTDGETCIDLDRHEPAEVAELMQTLDVAAMGAEINRRFRARVDFAADAERVGQALGLLVPA